MTLSDPAILFVPIVLLATAAFAMFLWWQLTKTDRQLTAANTTIEQLTDERDHLARELAAARPFGNRDWTGYLKIKGPWCTCHPITGDWVPEDQPIGYAGRDTCTIHGRPKPIDLSGLTSEELAAMAARFRTHPPSLASQITDAPDWKDLWGQLTALARENYPRRDGPVYLTHDQWAHIRREAPVQWGDQPNAPYGLRVAIVDTIEESTPYLKGWLNINNIDTEDKITRTEREGEEGLR